MGWHCKAFDELKNIELYEILKLRVDVFVVEQNCPYHEIDGNDLESIHLFYKDEKGIQAYTRLLPGGVKYKTPSIGRVIVRKELRGTGLGHKLMDQAIEAVLSKWNPSSIYLQAQTQLINFYTQHGFESQSDPYMDDGILHVDMLKKIKNFTKYGD